MNFHTLLDFEVPRVPEPPSPIDVEWRPARGGTPKAWHEELGQENGWADLGTFAQRLSAAEILTTHPGMLSGAQVLLPYGVKLIERMMGEVCRVYEEHGLERYEYSTVVPTANITAVRDVLDIEEKVVYIGEKQDFRESKPAAALCPSGEEVIYAHWKHIVRDRRNLPIRMYRRASYFRPRRGSGQSVFRSLEARDVMEFHLCLAGETERLEAADGLVTMLRSLLDTLAIPSIFSTRPLWGNRDEVSLCTVGVDTPLPTGSTIQSGCLYHQAQLFSKALAIGMREGGKLVHTHHLTGAVSRRLLFIHLLLGMSSDGALLLHPNVAPEQVSVVFQATEAEPSLGLELTKGLRAQGLRVRFDRVQGGAGRLQAQLQRQGMPVQILVQGKRHADDLSKVVVMRADTREEWVLTSADPLPVLLNVVPRVVEAVGQAYRCRAMGFLSRQLTEGRSQDLQELLRAHRVVYCPLLPSQEVTQTIASWRSGEVLGFQRSPDMRACVVSGRPTEYVAYCSPRL